MEEQLYRQIGRRIRSAREQSGMSQDELARRMGYTSSATISHFETGLRKVSLADLHRLSEILGVPIEYLLSIEDTPTMQRFRLRAQEVRPSVREEVATFLAFAENHGRSFPRALAPLRNQRTGDAAKQVLQLAAVSGPPVSPSEVAKILGVPVFYWDFPNEVSGIVVLERDRTCIGVNQHHPNTRQRFTIAHELGHLVYDDKESMLVDFSDMEVTALFDETQRKLESNANQFAADLLMPYDWIRKDFKKPGNDATLLAQRYEVSEQALWFRLKNLKLVEP